MTSYLSHFKALADETRYRILDLLLTNDLCVGALANRMGVSKAAISQHLQILRKAGLVKGEKRGYWTHYVVERNALKHIASGLDKMASQEVGPEGVCLRTITPGLTISKERGKMDMCKDCCEHPEKLKGRPEDCTLEQIEECHGDTQGHPCDSER